MEDSPSGGRLMRRDERQPTYVGMKTACINTGPDTTADQHAIKRRVAVSRVAAGGFMKLSLQFPLFRGEPC